MGKLSCIVTGFTLFTLPILYGNATALAQSELPEKSCNYCTWTDSKANTVEAKLVELRGKSIKLKGKNGKNIKVRINDLSTEDRQDVKHIRKVDSVKTENGKRYKDATYQRISKEGKIVVMHSQGVSEVKKDQLSENLQKRWCLPKDETLQKIQQRAQKQRRKTVHIKAEQKSDKDKEQEEKEKITQQNSDGTSTGSRIWNARDRKVEAEYVSCNNGIVQLKSAGGKTFRIPMWELSEQDQMFVVRSKGWAVVKAHRRANVKASLEVRLAERVNKEMLRTIANELHGFPDNKQPRLFITYYLPDTEIEESFAWATTHFDPNLEVRVNGATKEEHTHLLNETNSPTGDNVNVIGRWMDTTAFPGVITLLKKDGKVIMRKKFEDGSEGEYEMEVRQVGSQTRYTKKNSNTSDYMVIKENGDLAYGTDDGIWTTLGRIK